MGFKSGVVLVSLAVAFLDFVFAWIRDCRIGGNEGEFFLSENRAGLERFKGGHDRDLESRNGAFHGLRNAMSHRFEIWDRGRGFLCSCGWIGGLAGVVVERRE